MTDCAPAVRTLADADVEAIASRVHELLTKPKIVVKIEKVKIERMPRTPDVVSPERERQRSIQADVSPDNADHQDIPAPMLQALLANWERRHGQLRAYMT